jgi:hypothetical protein
MTISAKIAAELCRRTGISDTWLMENDPKAEMVGVDGKPYTPEIFRQRQLDFYFSEGPHYLYRELQLGVGFDILHRLLRAAQSKGNVKALMDDFEEFITAKLKDYPALDDTIRGEHRRVREAARKAGKAIPLGLLSPLGVEPFKRGRVRLAQAIATMTAGAKRKKRAKT